MHFFNTKKQIEAFAISAKQLYGKGDVITGNSSEFIDPVFSSGVTFATQSGLLAAKLVSKALNGQEVDWKGEYSKNLLQGINTFRTYAKPWYDSSLQDIFFYASDDNVSASNENIKRQICSVLAGYIWDKINPFVEKHEKVIGTLAKVVKMM